MEAKPVKLTKRDRDRMIGFARTFPDTLVAVVNGKVQAVGNDSAKLLAAYPGATLMDGEAAALL